MSVAIKVRRVLLASAARTVATACPQQTDDVLQYVRLYLNITVASGLGGLQPIIRGYDRVSGASVALSTGGTAIVATGLYVYEFMPTAQAKAGNVEETLSRMIPCVWDVNVAVGDSSSYTYSLSAELFPG